MKNTIKGGISRYVPSFSRPGVLGQPPASLAVLSPKVLAGDGLTKEAGLAPKTLEDAAEGVAVGEVMLVDECLD
jgi:hypothetical protein